MRRFVVLLSLSVLIALVGCRSTGSVNAPVERLRDCAAGAHSAGDTRQADPSWPGSASPSPVWQTGFAGPGSGAAHRRSGGARGERAIRGAAPAAARARLGFIVSPDGYIITNHHVVTGATSVQVRLYDGRRLTAQVVGTDARTDLAVIKVEGRGASR